MKQKGGQIKQLISVSKDIIKTSGNIGNDIAVGITKIIGGLSNGLEIVSKNSGKTLNNLSKNLGIASVKVFSKIGHLGLRTSKKLGDVVQIIPILGKPVAFVVKGSGKGVYYLVTSVGNVTGKSIRTVGRIGKETSDLIVFTIVSTKTATNKTIKEAGQVLKKVTKTITTKTQKKKRTKKKKTRKRN